MKSLNDIVKNFVRIHSYFHRGLEVKFDLDMDMPNVFNDFGGVGAQGCLLRTFSELAGEQYDARLVDNSLTKLRYSTLYVDGTQLVIIEHNGRPIPENILSRLNGELTRIGNGESNTGRVTGNVRAAFQAYDVGGKISIENHPNWRYKVEVTVQLPTKAPVQHDKTLKGLMGFLR